MYSFGDKTAFPLRDNFLDTLTATVKACAALFACEVEIERSDSVVHTVTDAASIELMRLEQLQEALFNVLAQASGDASTRAAQSLRQSGSNIIHQGRQAVVAQRDQLIAKATPRDLAGRVRKILTTFLLKKELPNTQWSFHWCIDAEGNPQTELRAVVRDIATTFRASPLPSHVWSDQIPVASLMTSLNVETPIWTRRARGTETKSTDLGEFTIVEIESSASRRRLLLRRNAKAKHDVQITLADVGQARPNIALVDEQSEVLGIQHHLSFEEQEQLSRLWSLIQEQRTGLIDARTQVTSIAFETRSVETVDHPAEIAERLLSCIAPLAREIRLRSRVPGELILKKETGEGRREELFLPRETLQALYGDLPDHYRRVFDAMGLGSESTVDFVTMIGSSTIGSGTKSSMVEGLSALEPTIDELIEDDDEDYEDAKTNVAAGIINNDAA